jgi:hypothetical protein
MSEKKPVSMSIEGFKDHREEVIALISKRLLHVPKVAAKNFPKVIREQPTHARWGFENEFRVFLLLFMTEKNDIRFASEVVAGRNPFVGLFDTSGEVPVAFALENAQGTYIKSNVVENMALMRLSGDSSAIVEDTSIKLRIEGSKEIEYTIDLALVLSFSEAPDSEQFLTRLDNLLSYAVSQWTS